MSPEQFQALIQQVKQLSADERKQFIKYLEESAVADRQESEHQSRSEPTDYLALFGSGRGGFTTAEEADNFVREERNAWDN
ncbi:MAG: hypothetical protein H0V18_02035 [Pyrinomonadaceae bacterium]|jgi:hypothetical protein|nr:hypothetical protein [Pyrinomonadaceae bacterium]